MYQAQFSHNPLYCVDIIKTYKPDFTPRVAFILGSGLGALADQIENAVAISYESCPGFPVSTVHAMRVSWCWVISRGCQWCA